MQACLDGDKDSKQTITNFAPDMKVKLEWENLKVGIEKQSSDMSIVCDYNLSSLSNCSVSTLDQLIDTLLLSQQAITDNVEQAPPQVAQAYTNYLNDILPEADTSACSSTISNTHIKCLQPHRERPSKDRSKRFAAGDLPLDSIPSSLHDLWLYQFWTVHPSKASL